MQYSARLVRREVVAKEILIVNFEKPDGFEFLPGQFCFVSLPARDSANLRDFRRPLSIASSPLEEDLCFAVRMSDSAFKRGLRDMAEGDSVALDSPAGLLTLIEDTASPIVLLAGGLGITPFRSMLVYTAATSPDYRVSLFYSFRNPEEAVFLDELRVLAAQHSTISVVPTVTRPGGEIYHWPGRTGRITAEMIKENVREWADALYYISGPPAMVDSTRWLLQDMGITQEQIKIEKWE